MAFETVNVDEVHQFVQFIANKEQSGNTMGPTEFNLLLRRAADDYFRWMYGLPHDYQPNFPLPAPAYELTQKVKDDLRVLKKRATLSVDTQGRMIIPDDYIHVTSITYNRILNPTEPCCENGATVTPIPVEIIDDDKWAGRVGSTIKAPTNRYPVCNFRKDHIQFMPINLGEVDFEYLRSIVEPIWGFTLVDDTPIYNAAGSTDLEYPKIVTNDIVRLILSYVGINLREGDLLSYAEAKKAEGV